MVLVRRQPAGGGRPLIEARSERRCSSLKKGQCSSRRSFCYPRRIIIASVTLEHGLLFFNKRVVGAPEIFSLHANCLRLSFAFNRLVYRHVPLLM